MANNGEIIIRFVEGEGKPKKVDPTGQDKKKEDPFDTYIKSIVLNKVLKAGVRTVFNEAKYQINRNYTFKDDYMGQQNMNISIGIAEKIISTGLSMWAGGKVGFTAGGVPGAIIGVTVALGSSLVNTAIDISHNYEQERVKLNQMDAQLHFNRQRAGYSLTVGAQGENR